jgi:SurA N-terminal domain/PPIC-type PPIASE domain
MVKKRLSRINLKRGKKVRELIPDAMAEKAMALNPLQPDEPQVLGKVPRITNETITEHREEVLKGARKYIYPLQHSKHRIVTVTLSIVVVALIAFFIYCLAALYRFYQYNTFIYRVTQVVPFPVARADHNFVDYENYLFELRRFVHYYQTQQRQSFNNANQDQLQRFKTQALNRVIDDAYVKILAKQNHVSVSGKEVDARVNEARAQNRLGSNNKVFADVLRDYWGWSIDDFKRSLRQEILAEKVSAKLDQTDSNRAESALAQIKSGADFAAVAKAMSDDPTKVNGGDYGFSINRSNPNVSPEVVDQLFKLKAGQVSPIILASPVLANTPPSLQIVKVIQTDGNNLSAQHIVVFLKDPAIYVADYKKAHPAKTYVHF